MNQIYFKEIQRFRELAFFALIWVLQILFIALMTKQMIFHKPVGINPMSDLTFIIINLFLLAMNLLLSSMILKTEVNDKGISIKFYPFHLKEKIISWSELSEIRFIKYDGIKEYYGYGMRYLPKKGWCYTISGNFGIKLYLKNGKNILIGTHKQTELLNTMKEIDYKDLIPKEIKINY
jgi:hypothetical protein